MKEQNIEIRKLTIPIEAVKKLTDEQRFVYYLFGHIFNELMCLQKLIAFAFPKCDDAQDHRFLPEVGQALFFCRLACSKIWEAQIAINQGKEIQHILRKDIFPRMEDGEKKLDELNKMIGSSKWISRLRNTIGFHYPKFNIWKTHIKPDDLWTDDEIFISDKSGNTYYHGADAVAHSWMFKQYEAIDSRSGVEPLMEELSKLIPAINSFLENALGIFISEVIADNTIRCESIGQVSAPDFEEFSIPFWTSIPTTLK